MRELQQFIEQQNLNGVEAPNEGLDEEEEVD